MSQRSERIKEQVRRDTERAVQESIEDDKKRKVAKRKKLESKSFVIHEVHNGENMYFTVVQQGDFHQRKTPISKEQYDALNKKKSKKKSENKSQQLKLF